MGLRHERLVEALDYSPESGIFVWLEPRAQRKCGDIAGAVKRGYIVIQLDGEAYQAHRLAWFYIHKEWPPEQIDHINRIRTDNRLGNLRLASKRLNAWNKAWGSQYTGVRKITCRKGWWTAYYGKEYLGCFRSPEEAHQAYLEKRKALETELIGFKGMPIGAS